MVYRAEGGAGMSYFRKRFDRFAHRMICRHMTRMPDFIIGGHDHPYLLRWYIVPWRKWHREGRAKPTAWRRVKGWFGLMLPSVYLHCFLRSDDDRALHDHPWFWCSILLRGDYTEHTVRAGGVQVRCARTAPSLKVSTPWRAHRVEVGDQPCWTLFITGPRMREWYFHCPRGLVHWRVFTAADDPGSIGRGCGEG